MEQSVRKNRIPRCHRDRKSTRLNSSHTVISYAVFCLKKKKHTSELQSHSNPVCRLLVVQKTLDPPTVNTTATTILPHIDLVSLSFESAIKFRPGPITHTI